MQTALQATIALQLLIGFRARLEKFRLLDPQASPTALLALQDDTRRHQARHRVVCACWARTVPLGVHQM